MDIENVCETIERMAQDFCGNLVTEDVGIGDYEYWGSYGHDSRMETFPEDGEAFAVHVFEEITKEEEEELLAYFRDNPFDLCYSNDETEEYYSASIEIHKKNNKVSFVICPEA